MHYVIYCVDKSGATQVRADNRSAHLAFIDTWGPAVRLGGPLLSDDGESMIGSMIVLEAESRDDVDRFIANDPYGLAGLFERVTVHPYKLVINNA